MSIDALRAKLIGEKDGSNTGSSSAKSSNGNTAKKASSYGRVSRKQRDPLELFNSADEVATGTASEGIPAPPREPTPLEAAAQAIAEAEEGFIIARKIFKLGPSDLLVSIRLEFKAKNILSRNFSKIDYAWFFEWLPPVSSSRLFRLHSWSFSCP